MLFGVYYIGNPLPAFMCLSNLKGLRHPPPQLRYYEIKISILFTATRPLDYRSYFIRNLERVKDQGIYGPPLKECQIFITREGGKHAYRLRVKKLLL